MLSCVVNLSTSNPFEIAQLSRVVEEGLIDVHADAAHNRSVFTLSGPVTFFMACELARHAVTRLDIRVHEGKHPRLGVLDVVPFVPVGDKGLSPNLDLTVAIGARNAFGEWASTVLGLPCFLYGPERSLPEVRRRAFRDLAPDFVPSVANQRAGACCVGARPALVAYNLDLRGADLFLARQIASRLRGPSVRALGLDLGDRIQVSCNLIDPVAVGPAQVYDNVAEQCEIERAELVGLIPQRVLETIPPARDRELDLDLTRTVEARLHQLGLSGSVH